MKSVMLPAFYQLFDYAKPKTICEIGTHDAKSAVQFVDYCIKLNRNLKYFGYDIFDDVKYNDEFHTKEINGKGAGKISKAKANLNHRKHKYKFFKFQLFQGYTEDTLKNNDYDFVYIDGGHSYETVKHDYNKVKNSKVIVFDDYQTQGVKKFVDELLLTTTIQKTEWNKFVNAKKPCYCFLPKTSSKHLQVAIINE